MELSDFSPRTPWAIEPWKLAGLAEGYAAGQIVAAQASKKPRESQSLQKQSKVALLPVYGPITKRSSFVSMIFGGSGLDEIGELFEQAIADPAISAVVLDIDSPGGVLSGVSAFADRVFQGRGKKPIIAFANGMMASGAYWIGSAANLVVAERTALVGSIGVTYIHRDLSQRDEQIGLKRTVITAGRFKAVGSDAYPLSSEDREIIQAELDTLYGLFIGAVAKNRGASEEAVRRHMADGRVFIGQEAVKAGLADKVGSLGDAIAAGAALADGKPLPSPSKALATGSHHPNGGETMKDFEALVDDHIANKLRLGQNCTRVEAMRAVAQKYPDAHMAYIEQANRNRKDNYAR